MTSISSGISTSVSGEIASSGALSPKDEGRSRQNGPLSEKEAATRPGKLPRKKNTVQQMRIQKQWDKKQLEEKYPQWRSAVSAKESEERQNTSAAKKLLKFYRANHKTLLNAVTSQLWDKMLGKYTDSLALQEEMISLCKSFLDLPGAQAELKVETSEGKVKTVSKKLEKIQIDRLETFYDRACIQMLKIYNDSEVLRKDFLALEQRAVNGEDWNAMGPEIKAFLENYARFLPVAKAGIKEIREAQDEYHACVDSSQAERSPQLLNNGKALWYLTQHMTSLELRCIGEQLSILLLNASWEHGPSKEWTASQALLSDELTTFDSVELALVGLEKKPQLTDDELVWGRAAAMEQKERAERIIRISEQSAADYAKLPGVKDDDQVLSALKNMAAAAREALPCLERDLSIWEEPFREFESLSLNEPLQTPSPPQGYVKKAAHSASGTASSSDSSLPQENEFHSTNEGLVAGKLNPQGVLEARDREGAIFARYFKDPDSTAWIRDYEKESRGVALPEQAIPAAEPAATRHEAAEALARKARNIVNAADKAIMQGAGKGCSYDADIQTIRRAFSSKTRAILNLREIKAELTLLQKEDGAPLDHLFSAVDADLVRLQQEKSRLDKQLHDLELASQSDMRKKRAPTEAGLVFLLDNKEIGYVATTINRQKRSGESDDWLDRHMVYFKDGAQGEQYAPWVIHAHYSSEARDAAPRHLHLKRDAEKDWGTVRESQHQRAYHSPLSEKTLARVVQLAQQRG